MQETFITVQELRTRVIAQGDGQTVLFVHGNPDSADMWRGVIACLPAEGYRYLAIDLPGFGKSDADDRFDYSIQNRGQYLCDALNAMGIRDTVIVVAHDHGGLFGASFAVQYPERIKGLVLQNTLFQSDYIWHPIGKAWRTPLIGEFLIRAQQIKFLSAPIIYWYMKWGSPLITMDRVREIQRHYNMKMGRAILRIYRATDPEKLLDWEDRLYDFVTRKSTLVLWGIKDRICLLALLKGFANGVLN